MAAVVEGPISCRSIPAQKAGPLAQSRMAPTEASAPAWSSTRVSPRHSSELRALRFSGRLRVTRNTRPCKMDSRTWVIDFAAEGRQSRSAGARSPRRCPYYRPARVSGVRRRQCFLAGQAQYGGENGIERVRDLVCVAGLGVETLFLGGVHAGVAVHVTAVDIGDFLEQAGIGTPIAGVAYGVDGDGHRAGFAPGWIVGVAANGFCNIVDLVPCRQPPLVSVCWF